MKCLNVLIALGVSIIGFGCSHNIHTSLLSKVSMENKASPKMVLTEVASFQSGPSLDSDGIGTYGGECTLGYSVRASIFITQNNNCVPQQSAPIIVSCLSDGNGNGRWSYQFDAASVNNGSTYGTFSLIFDLYETSTELSFEEVLPVGRVWANEASSLQISSN